GLVLVTRPATLRKASPACTEVSVSLRRGPGRTMLASDLATTRSSAPCCEIVKPVLDTRGAVVGVIGVPSDDCTSLPVNVKRLCPLGSVAMFTGAGGSGCNEDTSSDRSPPGPGPVGAAH